VLVAVVADGDGVRIAAGVHAADHLVVDQAHHDHIAGHIAGDEGVGAVGCDGDAARFRTDVDGVTHRHRRIRREIDDAHGAVERVGDVGA
jgi:hypothetical protein